MLKNIPALTDCLARNPSMLRVSPKINLALLKYMGKFRVRRVGGRTVLHSHLPPLNSPAYGRFVRDHLLGKSPGPSHAQIGLTDACPQKCGYCYNKGRQGTVMDSATIRRTISDLKAMGVFWLGFTGGEPLLNRDIVEITAEASTDCAVKLFTTGSGLTPALATRLKDAGLFSVSVSLDHWTAEVHDAARGTAGAFQTALRAIEIFRAAGIHTSVSAVLSAEMIRRGQVEPYLEFLQGLGLDEAWLSELKPSIQLPDNPSGLITQDERQSLIRLQDRWNRAGGMTVNYLGHFEGPDNFGCNAGRKMIYVDAFGEVSPCVFVPMTFGNVRQKPLAKIWSEMRNDFAPGSDCFLIRNQDLLRSRANGPIPIPPEVSRDLMRDVHFSAPGRFVGLIEGSGGRAT